MSVLIFANPFSGSGANQAHMRTLTRELAALGIDSHIAWSPEAGRDLLETHGANARAVVVAGGDGSIAMNMGLLQKAGLLGQLAFATFPVGNENLFAKHFGFGRDTKQLARHLARGQTRQADLGLASCANQPPRPFALMAGMGLDGEVVRRIELWRHTPSADNPHQKRRVTRRSYVPHVLQTLRHYRHPPLVLEADGQTHTGVLAMVCNLPEYGGNLRIARAAKDDDGLLDWVLFTQGGVGHGLRYAFSAYLGRHLRLPDVLHGQAKKITLRPQDAPVPLQIDGDGAGLGPVTFEAWPHAFQVVDTR